MCVSLCVCVKVEDPASKPASTDSQKWDAEFDRRVIHICIYDLLYCMWRYTISFIRLCRYHLLNPLGRASPSCAVFPSHLLFFLLAICKITQNTLLHTQWRNLQNHWIETEIAAEAKGKLQVGPTLSRPSLSICAHPRVCVSARMSEFFLFFPP